MELFFEIGNDIIYRVEILRFQSVKKDWDANDISFFNVYIDIACVFCNELVLLLIFLFFLLLLLLPSLLSFPLLIAVINSSLPLSLLRNPFDILFKSIRDHVTANWLSCVILDGFKGPALVLLAIMNGFSTDQIGS